MSILSLRSKRDIQSIVNDIETKCDEHQFVLLHHYAYHEVVADKGFPINRKVYIFEVCQAKVASMMLISNPHFSPFMPCRIAVYEEEHSTIISTQNMQIMLDSIQEQQPLHEEAVKLFEGLQGMMRELQGYSS